MNVAAFVKNKSTLELLLLDPHRFQGDMPYPFWSLVWSQLIRCAEQGVLDSVNRPTVITVGSNDMGAISSSMDIYARISTPNCQKTYQIIDDALHNLNAEDTMEMIDCWVSFAKACCAGNGSTSVRRNISKFNFWNHADNA